MCIFFFWPVKSVQEPCGGNEFWSIFTDIALTEVVSGVSCCPDKQMAPEPCLRHFLVFNLHALSYESQCLVTPPGFISLSICMRSCNKASNFLSTRPRHQHSIKDPVSCLEIITIGKIIATTKLLKALFALLSSRLSQDLASLHNTHF